MQTGHKDVAGILLIDTLSPVKHMRANVAGNYIIMYYWYFLFVCLCVCLNIKERVCGFFFILFFMCLFLIER